LNTKVTNQVVRTVQ